jgi:DNA-binding transcriptional MocR family regulator
MVVYQIDPLDTSFVQVLSRILFDLTLPQGARLTYAALVEHYRDNDKCWPSMERLASMVGCCVRTIQNHITTLIARGLVTVTKRGYWKRANEYALHALVTPTTVQASQPVARPDMRNPLSDMRNPVSTQAYKNHTNSYNNRSQRRLNASNPAGEAGAMRMFRRMGLQ